MRWISLAGPYGTFKAALIHYTQGLAYQWAGKGIRANTPIFPATRISPAACGGADRARQPAALQGGSGPESDGTHWDTPGDGPRRRLLFGQPGGEFCPGDQSRGRCCALTRGGAVVNQGRQHVGRDTELVASCPECNRCRSIDSTLSARQYWLRHGASPHRVRANPVKRGASQRSVPLFLETNSSHLQMLIN